MEVASIAQAAIHAYTTELPNTQFGADTTAAAANALTRVGQTPTSHASPHTVQAIGTAAISLYSGYTSDPDPLAPALAWEQTLNDILDAWSPPPHDRPPHRIEPVDQLIGTREERADVEIAHSEVARPDGGRWARQLHPLVTDALQQQIVAVPTVVLRDQLSDAIDTLDRRPADRTAQHDWVARQLASLHRQHRRSLSTLVRQVSREIAEGSPVGRWAC